MTHGDRIGDGLTAEYAAIQQQLEAYHERVMQGASLMAESDDGDKGSFLQSSDDPLSVSLFYGAITGATCVVAGYPLDTAKVRLQIGHKLNLSLFAKPYRGVLSPLVAVVPAWSANFLVYGAVIKFLADDSLSSVMVAGGVGGLTYGLAVCPFEMVKCNTQGTQVPLRETFAKLRSTYGCQVLYRGFGACLLRDAGQTSAYYSFAELLGRSRWLQSTFGERSPIVAGMLTGLGHCHVELPFDTVKTKMQTNLAYKGYSDVLGEIFSDGAVSGVRRLFKGYVPWMSRAMICHGSSFYVIVKARELFGF